MNYYNEFDPKAAAWLRELIKQGHIPMGRVDERSIADVQPDDLRDYTQCHFFAGIGGWPLALELAGWPDTRPVWTGSCPCQPFSAAGLGRGEADERHLWPAWFKLIRQCRPGTIFGEQVASKAALGWFDGVSSDLEAEGYAAAAFDLCSAGVGAPHIRQRLHWVADHLCGGRHEGEGQSGEVQAARGRESESPEHCGVVGLAQPDGGQPGDGELQRGGEQRFESQDGGDGERLANSENGARERAELRGDSRGDRGESLRMEYSTSNGWEQWRAEPRRRRSIEPRCTDSRLGDTPHSESARLPVLDQQLPRPSTSGLAHHHQGLEVGGAEGQRADAPASALACRPWSDFDLLPCLDGKARRVESGTFPLAHGIPGRVGLLRGYGNAINPWLAALFIQAYDETL